MNDTEGANCEIFPDAEAGRVIARFLHPETGEVLIQLELLPDVAREMAFSLTRASIPLEL